MTDRTIPFPTMRRRSCRSLLVVLTALLRGRETTAGRGSGDVTAVALLSTQRPAPAAGSSPVPVDFGDVELLALWASLGGSR